MTDTPSPPVAPDAALLTLVMIVKNEARGIEATLLSAKPFVDRWVILDTGSTDGTQELVRKTMEGVPSELHEEPFVDFGATRSRALDLAGEATTFTLMLSGDETLENGAALRAFCEKHAATDGVRHGAYHVRVAMGDTEFDHARLARAKSGWRYVGATHEFLGKEKTPPPTIRVPDARIVHDTSHRTKEGMRARWELDKRLLREQLKKHPNDARAQFYFAQTLECLGDLKQAAQAYERRIKMGGWQEEVYESWFRLARTMEAGQRPWAGVLETYLDAHAHSPTRAEPLFKIAWHYYQKKSWALCYLFARRGAELPFPEKATLFVDREVYTWKLLDLVGTSAYYVGAFEEGEAALRKALVAMPGDARLTKNLAFYEERKNKE